MDHKKTMLRFWPVPVMILTAFLSVFFLARGQEAMVVQDLGLQSISNGSTAFTILPNTSTSIPYLTAPNCIKSMAASYDQLVLENIYCQNKTLINRIDLLTQIIINKR